MNRYLRRTAAVVLLFSTTCLCSQEHDRESRALTYRKMRIEYSKSKDYDPYASGLEEIQLNADRLLEEGKFDECLEQVEDGLVIYRFNIQFLVDKAAALRAIGKTKRADEIRAKWMSLIDSILLGSDGSSFESAFQVISVAEEYAVLNLFRLRPTKQMLVEHEASEYDVVNVATDDDGTERSIYFNVDIPKKWLYEKLRRSQSPEQADQLGRADTRPLIGSVRHKKETTVVNPLGLIFVAAGVFSMLGAIYNWEWFVNARKARFVVKLLTRNGARIFYGVLGLAIAVLGLLGTMGIVDMSS